MNKSDIIDLEYQREFEKIVEEVRLKMKNIDFSKLPDVYDEDEPDYLDGDFTDRMDYDDDGKPIFPREVDYHLASDSSGHPSISENEYNRRVEEIKQKRREAKQKANS